MRARRLAAVALTFAVAIAVFAATRGDERAAAGPPTTGAAALDARRAASTDEQLRTLQQSSAPAPRARPSSRPPISRRRARPATRASTPAPTECSRERSSRGRTTRPSWSRRAGSPPAATTSAARCAWPAAPPRSRPTTPAAPRCSSTRSSSSGATGPPSACCSARSTASRISRAYARVAYLRELHGDLPGAAAALRLAIAAGGSTRENGATVRVLLGDARAGARPARRRGPRVPGGAGRGAAPARRGGRASPAWPRARDAWRRRSPACGGSSGGCRCPST